jgi:hypothetical protein
MTISNSCSCAASSVSRAASWLSGLATWVAPRVAPLIAPLGMRGRSAAQPVWAQAEPEALDVDRAVGNLTHLIETGRQQAIASGVRPVPAAVHRSLLGYFPSIVLHKTRFAEGRGDVLTLPSPAFSRGNAAAVTLGEVVLFKTERLAQSDLKLWAHELTHVMQYQRWGIDGFADHCVHDFSAVQQEANDNADRFMAWLSRHGD